MEVRIRWFGERRITRVAASEQRAPVYLDDTRRADLWQGTAIGQAGEYFDNLAQS